MRKSGELSRGSLAFPVSRLQRYCICIIRFISNYATDPHRYFEQKLTGDVFGSESSDQLMTLLRYLLHWVDSLGISPNQIAQLEKTLATEGLPSYSSLRAADDEAVEALFAKTVDHE